MCEGLEEMLLASLKPAVKPEPEVEWDGFVEMTRASLENAVKPEPCGSGNSSSVDWSAVEAFIDAMEEIQSLPPPQASLAMIHCGRAPRPHCASPSRML